MPYSYGGPSYAPLHSYDYPASSSGYVDNGGPPNAPMPPSVHAALAGNMDAARRWASSNNWVTQARQQQGGGEGGQWTNDADLLEMLFLES